MKNKSPKRKSPMQAVYVKNPHVWVRAKATAQARGVSLSTLVEEALYAYLAVLPDAVYSNLPTNDK